MSLSDISWKMLMYLSLKHKLFPVREKVGKATAPNKQVETNGKT